MIKFLTIFLFVFIAGVHASTPAFLVESDYEHNFIYNDSMVRANGFSGQSFVQKRIGPALLGIRLGLIDYSFKQKTTQDTLVINQVDGEFRRPFVGFELAYNISMFTPFVRMSFNQNGMNGVLASLAMQRDSLFVQMGVNADWVNLDASWADTLLPAESSPIIWKTNSIEQQFWGGIKWNSKGWGIRSKVAFQLQTPQNLDSGYVVKDSMLALQGDLNGYVKYQNYFLHVQMFSFSGARDFVGLRYTSDGFIRFMNMRTGFEFNSLLFALSKSADFAENNLQEKSELFARLNPFKQLLGNPLQSHFALGASQLLVKLYAPGSAEKVGSFSANRLFAPGIIDVLGYVFYQKTLNASGSFKLNQFQMQLNRPFDWGDFSLITGAVLSYYRVELDADVQVKTANLFANNYENMDQNLQVDLMSLVCRFGGAWRLNKSLQWVSTAEQFLPYVLNAKVNEKSLNQKSNDASSHLLRSGLVLRTQLQYSR